MKDEEGVGRIVSGIIGVFITYREIKT